jgi:hypothetical protein
MNTMKFAPSMQPVPPDTTCGNSGRPQCPDCPWLGITRAAEAGLRDVNETVIQGLADTFQVLDDDNSEDGRRTAIADATAAVEGGEIAQTVFAAEISPCDGSVVESRFRVKLPLLPTVRLGRMVVRCSNEAVPYKRLPETHYPGRRSMWFPARNQ